MKSCFSSPKITDIPLNSEHRLLDEGLLHYEASSAGFAERYKRGETTHTIHVWWARRPHISMRILSFAALCKELSTESLDILTNFGKPSILSSRSIGRARAMLMNQYPNSPKVLDMFGGGGTIPFEVANLGAKAYSIDINQLSTFVQKANLLYSQEHNQKDIINLVKQSGTRVLNSLRRDTEILFPLRKEYNRNEEDILSIKNDIDIPFAYFWTYSVRCPACRYRYYLSKRPWLSKKKDKRIALLFRNERDRQRVIIDRVTKELPNKANWMNRNGKPQCPVCGHVMKKLSIKNSEDELVAVAKPAGKRGKDFCTLNLDVRALPSIIKLKNMEKQVTNLLGCQLPKSKLPKWSGIVNPALYGIETHSDFLNIRQRLVLLFLIKCLFNEYNYLAKQNSVKTAKFVICILSSFIDQLVDWNCRLSMWIPQNEQVGRAFCGPGVSMLWDYVEIDPVLNGPANLWAKLDRILAGLLSIPKFVHKPVVKNADAQKLPFRSGFFDAIVTDPPYYDNLYYSILADFFYVWKRILLRNMEPALLTNDTTRYEGELVASTFRSGKPQKAHEAYCSKLTRALKEAGRVLRPEGLIAFIYSHSSLKGWAALIKAFRESKFLVTSVQPLSIERKDRPRGHFSEAVNTCLVFVGHKTNKEKKKISIKEICDKVTTICTNYANSLKIAGWHESDIALAAFAHGVGYLANYKEINDVISDEQALICVEKSVKEHFSGFRIQNRNPL